ncbi:hypothetical protein [Pseudonocardia ammonioxydans]|uniref:hypothetical protein n=1 Tax=Pseudonocardia ammonioxydans TaxID=260086 RepID=UPI001160DF04|nr:hypothetical protein [Pseudonocardia ammonioxydans]
MAAAVHRGQAGRRFAEHTRPSPVPAREISARRAQGGFADDLDWVAGYRAGVDDHEIPPV